MRPVICAEDLGVTLKIPRRPEKQLVRNVNFEVQKGECLGILGESGSGKSMSVKAMLGLLDKNFSVSGHAWFAGKDLLRENGESLRKIRGSQIAVVLQNPMTCFDPLYRIGSQMAETFAVHTYWKRAKILEASLEVLEKMRIHNPEEVLGQYPHQLSGGMRQRVMIAMALLCNPKLLIADEPTTALDVTIQAQILQLIRDLQKELGMSVIYITHDLGVVANVADRVAVMYAGQIVEYGTVQEIFYDAWHPYTWALLQALPQLGTKGESLPTVDGTPPNLFNEIHGDAFAPRNKHALAIDFVAEPPFFQVSETHAAKTWYLDPRAPKIERPHSIQNLREKMGKMGGSNLNG